MLPTDKFIIEQLIYIPVGSHVPVLNRPYVVNSTQGAIETIAQRVHETRSGKITPNIVNGVAGEILTPSAVGYDTSVNADWISTRRFIFMMIVRAIEQGFGVEKMFYITGFTNYDGISNTGNIDPNLDHQINNIIETTQVNIQTPMGGFIRKEKLLNIYNVFSSSSNATDLYTQRPADILENIATNEVINMMGDNTNSISGYSVSNYINQYNNQVIGSNIDNNIPTSYLSKILTTGILANKSKEFHLGSFEISEQYSLDSRVPEPSITENRFIKFINSMAGYKVPKPSFVFNQLLSYDNTIYSRFVLLNINKDFVDPLKEATPEVGEYWHGRDIVTLKAYSLIESSVSLAVKYGFNKLYFIASNMSNPTGIVEVFITNYKSFINLSDEDFNYLLELFKEKFVTEIFLNETMNGAIPMYAEFFIDLIGTSKIKLSYSGFPETWYTIPTFANSQFSPVVTVNKDTFDYTSMQLGTIIDGLTNSDLVSRPYF